MGKSTIRCPHLLPRQHIAELGAAQTRGKYMLSLSLLFKPPKTEQHRPQLFEKYIYLPFHSLSFFTQLTILHTGACATPVRMEDG